MNIVALSGHARVPGFASKSRWTAMASTARDMLATGAITNWSQANAA
ncbi:MAG: hypothetical protein ABJV68_30430 [Paracoccaceae bacterium]